MEDNKKMPGYTGYKPQFLTEDTDKNTRDNRFFIPGKFTLLSSPYHWFNRLLWIRAKH